MSSPLWPTALSPVADGDVAVRRCSRNPSFQRADSYSSTPSSAPRYPGVCTPKASKYVLPFALHLCEVPTAGNCCINTAKSFLLRDFIAEQAVSVSIRVKAGSWRLCVSSLLCCRETRSAGVPAALTACLRRNIANSGLGQINLVSYGIDSTLAFEFSLEIKL